MRHIRTFALACCCAFSAAGSLPAQTLVHRWSFENNFNDTSGSSNHGAASGAPAFVAGRFGQGVSIASPSDGVHLDFGAANLPLLGTDSWSMNVWAKLAGETADLEYLAGFGLNDGFVGALDTGGTRAYLTFANITTPPRNNFYFWGGARDVDSELEYSADDEWHMYTMTYNGTAMQMYKDGAPVFAAPVPVALNAALDEVHVGNPSNWNSNFDGSLDEFAIFNGTLNASQVGGLFVNNDINQPVTLDPSLSVNRDTGEVVLTNDSSFAIEILGYTIRSATGSLKATTWDTIAGRFDSPPGGDGSIDPNNDWMVLTSTSLPYSIELSEGAPGTDGGTIPVGRVVNLGDAWVANPSEDLVIDLLLDDGQGTIKTLAAEFTGNGGEGFEIGDLDTDGDVDAADWARFRTAPVHNFTDRTIAEAYLSGDLDGDFDRDINDFSRFAVAFDAANGAGAFASLASVPEPASVALFAALATVVFAVRARRPAMCGVISLFIACSITEPTSAALWGYYKLNGDANEATGNNINLNPVGDASFNGSVHPGLGVAGAFDGDGDGMIGGNFNKLVSNNATVMAWAYADNLDGDWDSIVKNWGQTVGGQFHLGLGNGNANTLQNHLVGNMAVTTTTDFPIGQWIHVAFVIDSTALEHRLYANGQIVATQTYTGTLDLGTATSLGIAVKPNDDGSAVAASAQGYWAGRIDDIGIYDEALSTAQIMQAYQNGLAGIQLDGTTTPYIRLEVDRTNGNVTVKNTTAGAVSFNAYEVSSAGGSLRPANWQDLAGNAGFPTGNGTGNGWETDLASDETQLLETFLTGNSNFNAGTNISLGNIFAGGAEDLVFRFRTSNGAVIDSLVDYIGTAPNLVGDYNANGAVDAADYVAWRNALGTNTVLPNEDLSVSPGQVTQADYDVWRSRFGVTAGAAAAAAPIPEPSTIWMLALAALALRRISHARVIVR